MVLRSSQRSGRAALPVLDGVSSCLGSHMMALTDVSWEQRVLHACWRVSFLSTSAPSAPAAELTAAAAVGLLLEEENSGAKLRRVAKRKSHGGGLCAHGVLVRGWSRVSPGIARLAQRSLQEGVPSRWRTGCMVPVPKNP